MAMDAGLQDVFPADDYLFEERFFRKWTFTCFGQKIKLMEMFGADLGVAATVWDSALRLCEYFESEGLEFRGKRLIELGAGSGLVSILAARLGASVTVTDLPQVLPHILRNIEQNLPEGGWPSDPPTVLPLVWGRDLRRLCCDWDLVVGSDIVYLPETFPDLLETLVVLSERGALVYLASKMRREHGTYRFYQNCLPQCFRVQLLHRDHENNINVYKAALNPGTTREQH